MRRSAALSSVLQPFSGLGEGMLPASASGRSERRSAGRSWLSGFPVGGKVPGSRPVLVVGSGKASMGAAGSDVAEALRSAGIPFRRSL